MKIKDKYVLLAIVGGLIVIGVVFFTTSEKPQQNIISDMDLQMPKDGVILMNNLKNSDDLAYQKQKIEGKIKSLQSSIKTSERMLGMKTVNQEKLKERINEEQHKLELALDELADLNN
jgi:hypothetical protein